MRIFSDLAKIETSQRVSELVASWWRIKILVVTDTIVSFGPEHDPRNLNEQYFGMSHLMGVLKTVAAVTKAHRSQDPLGAADVMTNFRFDTHKLANYDQIWFLGFASGELPVKEQAAIAAFMNNGGGVFATGDHEGLGSALCGALPRVRSMRHWQSPPPALGADRVDTTQPDANGVVVFENQSDDIPQKLSLKWYEWSQHKFYREIYPHPLLCSRSGAIDEFPDHMHEGEVVVPEALDAQLTLEGSTFDEYPKDAKGIRIKPEVIAWGYSTGRADPEVMHGIHLGDTDPSNKRWTGTIGVYDGHRAKVGRVVVHSTWHHFFDINLIGDNAANRPDFNDPRAGLWRQGFTASPNGQRILAQIDQYYRNIVNWLSPRAIYTTRFDALVTQLAVNRHVREILEGSKLSATEIGAHVWEYALRLLPPCTIYETLFSFPEIYEQIPFPIVPWYEPNPGPDDAPMPKWPIPPKQLAQAALGGAIIAFTKIQSIEHLEKNRDTRELRTGAIEGLHGLISAEITDTDARLKTLLQIRKMFSNSRA